MESVKYFSSTIGIYPEWNVKNIQIIIDWVLSFIGIYPEWNVKLKLFKTLLAIFYHWNISRMECKEYIVKIIASKNYLIGIYPEWNVKQGCLFAVRLSTLLEYIQNGM